jgi:hypothetical protein
MTDMSKYAASIRHIEMPARIRKMRISPNHMPVPWFVAWVDGVPDFRAVDTSKIRDAYVNKKCWMCGEKLGRYLSFPLGPMCMVNRINSEPPSHHECAQYAVQSCPFLTRPHMRRNEKDLPTDRTPAPGIGIPRNPGAVVIWTTLSYKPFKVSNGVLFRLGDPVSVEFWTQGRRATRQEIMESIDSGMPLLREAAVKDGEEAVADLDELYQRAIKLVPQEEASRLAEAL